MNLTKRIEEVRLKMKGVEKVSKPLAAQYETTLVLLEMMHEIREEFSQLRTELEDLPHED